MRTVLLIVDMQEGSFTPRDVRHDAHRLIERINSVASQVRAANGVVIFVQHAGPDGDPHHPAAPGHKLLHELHVEENDVFVVKRSCDAFLDTDLDVILAPLKPFELIIMGCASDYCVDTTVRAALARNYPTIAPSDGHTTADRPHLSAQKIIEHHNAIWADFISPAGGARVAPTSSITIMPSTGREHDRDTE